MNYSFDEPLQDKWGNIITAFEVDNKKFKLTKLKNPTPKPNKTASYKISNATNNFVRLDIYEKSNNSKTYIFSDFTTFFNLEFFKGKTFIHKDELFNFMTEEEKKEVFEVDDFNFIISAVASQLEINEANQEI